MTACGCVSAGVHCGFLFCVRGSARCLHTLGFPSARSLRERLWQPPRPHTMHSPLPHPLCATSQDPEPLALCLLDHNLTETSDWLIQSRLLDLPCGLLIRSAFVNLIASDQMSTRCPRHPKMSARASPRHPKMSARVLRSTTGIIARALNN